MQLVLVIASAVTALTLLILALFLIPAFLQMKRAAVALADFAESTDKELSLLLQELRQAVAEVRVVTGAVAEHVDGVTGLMEELGKVGHHIKAINSVVGVVSTVVAGSSAWMTGARVAGRFVADKLIKKRG